MKKIIPLSVVTSLLVILALCLPNIVIGLLPQVSVTQLKNSTYTDKIFAAGKLEELGSSEISCKVPVVADKIYVSVGDTVALGDPIASINVAETKGAIAKLLSLSDYVSEETVSAFADLNLDPDIINSAIPSMITADYSGTVSNINISSGELAYPTETIATISDFDDIQAKLNIPEEYAGNLKVGQTVTLTVSATDETCSATVVKIFPSAHDTMVGTSQKTVVSCYAALDAKSDSIKAGYSVSAEIVVSTPRTISSIFYSAINQDDNEQEFLYVLENGKAIKRDVVTGIESEDMAQIISGLSPDDIVIADYSTVKRNGGFVKLNKAVPNV